MAGVKNHALTRASRNELVQRTVLCLTRENGHKGQLLSRCVRRQAYSKVGSMMSPTRSIIALANRQAQLALLCKSELQEINSHIGKMVKMWIAFWKIMDPQLIRGG